MALRYRERRLATKELPSEIAMDYDDVGEHVAGQSMRSYALSRRKKMLDMADGDEHFVKNLCVGPINDMYLKIRAYSAFPHGAGLVALIHDTQANRQVQQRD
jgi:hypothetical protein